jgi:hypothetical protein
VDGFLVFPVCGVWFNLQDLHVFPTYFVASSYAGWTNFDFPRRAWVRLHLCSLIHTFKGLLVSPM